MNVLDHKVALITGGSKGIGLGIAEAFMKQNMKVAITSRSKQATEEAVAQLSAIGKGEILGLEADVRDANAQEKSVNDVLKKWGSIDVLVANAGVGYFGSIDTLTIEAWQDTIDTNLTGVFHSIKSCLAALKKSKGYIITIASLAGTNFF